MFKADWEKASVTHNLPEGMVEQMVHIAYPNTKLISHKLIAGGCANLNIKIQLTGANKPLILRIYLRDQDAACREQKLGELLKSQVPVPITYHIGDYYRYRFAITEFMPGITLRDLLLSDVNLDIKAIMAKVGQALAIIAKNEFNIAGFFDKNLNIVTPLAKDDLKQFVIDECLSNNLVQSQLSVEIITKIRDLFENYSNLLPKENEHHLVHADFDPSNILVSKIKNSWEITAIIDWEFAFSGSILCDVANMLRYAHKITPQYEIGLLAGLQDAGICLPDKWRTTVHLLNLASLLDCIKRSDPINKPNQTADIYKLITYIIEQEYR